MLDTNRVSPIGASLFSLVNIKNLRQLGENVALLPVSLLWVVSNRKADRRLGGIFCRRRNTIFFDALRDAADGTKATPRPLSTRKSTVETALLPAPRAA